MADLRCLQCEHAPEHHPMKDGRECCVLTDCDCGQYVAPMQTEKPTVAKTEQLILATLLKAVKNVLEHDVHMDHCPETLMGNGNGPCDCPAKQLREAFSDCEPGIVELMLNKAQVEGATQAILDLANSKVPEDPVLQAHGLNILRSGFEQTVAVQAQIDMLREVLLSLAPYVAVLSRAPNVSPNARKELLAIEPRMLEILTDTIEQGKLFDRLTAKHEARARAEHRAWFIVELLKDHVEGSQATFKEIREAFNKHNARTHDAALEEAAASLVPKPDATTASKVLIAFCQGHIRSLKTTGTA